MKNILVTGAAGFVGKNLVTALQRLDEICLTTITSKDDQRWRWGQRRWGHRGGGKEVGSSLLLT